MYALITKQCNVFSGAMCLVKHDCFFWQYKSMKGLMSDKGKTCKSTLKVTRFVTGQYLELFFQLPNSFACLTVHIFRSGRFIGKVLSVRLSSAV